MKAIVGLLCGFLLLPASHAGQNAAARAKLAAVNAELKKNPADIAALLKRAELRLDAGDAARAEADFSRVLELAPDSADGWSGRGQVLLRRGRADEAIACFSKAINRAPGTARYYSLRAGAYAALGNYDRVLKNATQAVILAPRTGAYYHRRGLYYARAGHYVLAVKDYDVALALDRTDPITRNDRAYAFLRLAKWEEAYADAQAALKLEKNFPAAYLNMAAYWWAGKKNEAKALENVASALRVGLRDTKDLYDENNIGYFLRGFNKTPQFERTLAKAGR